MAAEETPLLVRALTRLVVIVDGTPCPVKLMRSQNEDDNEFLSGVYANLESKVLDVTNRAKHKVMSDSDLNNDDLKQIFRDKFRVPFENNGVWDGPSQQQTGLLRLEAPGTGTLGQVPTPATHACRSQKKTKAPPPSDVRFYGEHVHTICVDLKWQYVVT